MYCAAHRFEIAGEGISAQQKDLIHNRGRVGSAAYSAGTCVELGTTMILSIGLGVTGSATLFQFQGAGWKLALTAARGLQRLKE